MRMRLVLAARAAGLGTGLGVGGTFLGFGPFGHHLLEVDVATCRVLVPVLAGVESGSVGAVSIPGLEGVEVHGGTGLARIPGGVDCKKKQSDVENVVC